MGLEGAPADEVWRFYQMVHNEVRRDSRTYIAEIRVPFWGEVKDENETAEEALASNEPANSEAVNAEETVPPGQTVLCFQMARTTSPSHQEG